ncbi:MAG: hypothetical protein MUF24_14310, partial [Chitinophagaceae bacterium]|nr:hypothetical protein [Chitinophagaceae bacterium]
MQWNITYCKKGWILGAIFALQVCTALAQRPIGKKVEEVVKKEVAKPNNRGQQPAHNEGQRSDSVGRAAAANGQGSSNRKPSREEMTNSFDVVEQLFTRPFIFTNGELQVSGDAVGVKDSFVTAVQRSNAVIGQYTAAVTAFMAGNPSAYTYANKLKPAEARASGITSLLKQLEQDYKSGTSWGGVYYLQKLCLFKGYLESMTKVFPESEKLKEYKKLADDALLTYGTADKYLARMDENKKQMVKNLKLTPAGQRNAKIEELVKLKYQQFEKDFTVVKVNITDVAWRIEKNELGIPLNRKVSVSI